MKFNDPIRTSWTDGLKTNEVPRPDALREHLLEVHRLHPGFTESCASACKNKEGHTSYDWLCNVVEPTRHHRLLDLACGSGYLLDLCHSRFPNLTSLMGVDMSAAELALARDRLGGKDVVLHEALAQNLNFAASQSVDAVLCHWALTLMDPVEPVLEEIDRILSPGGVFAAIVDGDPAAAPGYEAVNDLIFQYVREELPTYGNQDLGDPRTRTPETLAALAHSVFDTANVSVETSVFSLEGAPEVVAKEAAGFFYAAFVLPAPARAQLLAELAELLQKNAPEGMAKFFMPVCRLVVRL